MEQNKKIIAVDFDGTIVEDNFPKIGKIIVDNGVSSITVINELYITGHGIIIWTCRCGDYLYEMINWLKKEECHYNTINSNVIETIGHAIPKIRADIYIDNNNFGGRPKWDNIYNKLILEII